MPCLGNHCRTGGVWVRPSPQAARGSHTSWESQVQGRGKAVLTWKQTAESSVKITSGEPPTPSIPCEKDHPRPCTPPHPTKDLLSHGYRSWHPSVLGWLQRPWDAYRASRGLRGNDILGPSLLCPVLSSSLPDTFGVHPLHGIACHWLAQRV